MHSLTQPCTLSQQQGCRCKQRIRACNDTAPCLLAADEVLVLRVSLHPQVDAIEWPCRLQLRHDAAGYGSNLRCRSEVPGNVLDEW